MESWEYVLVILRIFQACRCQKWSFSSIFRPVKNVEVGAGRLERAKDGLIVFSTIKNIEQRSITNPQFQINFYDKESNFIDQCQVTVITVIPPGVTQELKLRCSVPQDSQPTGYMLPTLETTTVERADSFQLRFLQAMPDFSAAFGAQLDGGAGDGS